FQRMRLNFVLPLIVIAASSCTAHAPFRVDPTAVNASAGKLASGEGRSEVAPHSIEIHPTFTLAFVEFDDPCRFWNRGRLAAPDGALEEESGGRAGGGMVVMVFAHGWHHDAGVCDENVSCYRTFLAQIARVADGIGRLSGGRMPARRVVGVYAAWRGPARGGEGPPPPALSGPAAPR